MLTQTHIVQSEAGQLELAISRESDATSPKAVAIICHPHPLMGGTMNNKIVTTLAKLFQQKNRATVRFQFRGVGQSTGIFDQGIGETRDLLRIVDYAKEIFSPDIKIYLAGFSFGALVAWRSAYLISCEQLILVAPPVINFPMENTHPLPCPFIVLQGESDDIVSAQDVLHWCHTQARPPQNILTFKDTGHFFHGKLMELQERLSPLLI